MCRADVFETAETVIWKADNMTSHYKVFPLWVKDLLVNNNNDNMSLISYKTRSSRDVNTKFSQKVPMKVKKINIQISFFFPANLFWDII